jgi:hypothetical protein
MLCETACSMVAVFFSVTVVGVLEWHALQELIL